MKKFACLIVVLTCFACSNDFELIEENRDVTIVYGILDLLDTAQYIRVERAFVDQTINANDLALDPNNFYYPELTVNVIGEDGTVYNFNKIDGDAEGLPRREGIFAQSPNILYKINSDQIPLAPGDEYTLQVIRPGELPVVTATTTIVDDGTITAPNSSASLNFDYIQPANFRWSRGDFSAIYDLSLLFRYEERDTELNTPFELKTVLWNIVSNSLTDEAKVEGISFYSFLNSAIPVDDAKVRRVVNCDVILTSGSEEVRDYISVVQANLGITSSQDIPVYTNLSEGRGLFASRTKFLRQNVGFTSTTRDSIVNGELLEAHNFEF